jgi:serine-aspartate repeat-containing protein C/D/E
VPVRLLIDSATQELASTTTAADGSYELPARLGGAYRVRVGACPGYPGFTRRDAGGDDERDSDVGFADGDRGQTATLRPPAGTATVGAGCVLRASVGNRVWFDTDADGVQDGGEPGVAGVQVQLWNGAMTQLVGLTTTNASGTYTLTTDMPGQHRVRVLLPAGRAFTTANAGGDDTLDSDVEAAPPGFTAAFTVGTNVIGMTLWDAGLVPG